MFFSHIAKYDFLDSSAPLGTCSTAPSPPSTIRTCPRSAPLTRGQLTNCTGLLKVDGVEHAALEQNLINSDRIQYHPLLAPLPQHHERASAPALPPHFARLHRLQSYATAFDITQEPDLLVSSHCTNYMHTPHIFIDRTPRDQHMLLQMRTLCPLSLNLRVNDTHCASPFSDRPRVGSEGHAC